MLAHPVLAILTALTVTTLLPSVQALPTNQDLQTLCPISDEGKFKCYSQTQYVLCQGSRTVVQSMAAGVPCVDSTGPVSQPPIPTSPNALSSPLPHPSPSTPSPATTAASASLDARASNTQQNPTYDQLRHGTKTPKTITCSKSVKVLGVSLDNLFHCVDSTHYAICKQNGPSDIFVVDWGFKCIQSQNGDAGVVVA